MTTKIRKIGQLPKLTEDHVSYYDLEQIAEIYSVDFSFLEKVGAEISTVSSTQIDTERSVSVAKLTWEKKLVAVIVLAGRGKDGGKLYVANKKLYAGLMSALLRQQILEDEYLQESFEIDSFVNGYNIELI